MTKQQTIEILAMLSAFYGKPKADAETMANGWHLILEEFSYESAKSAVIEFAKNDTRDYGTFPAPGVIVKIIQERQERYQRRRKTAISNISYGIGRGKKYDELPDDSRRLMTRDRYEYYLNDPMYYINNQAVIEKILMDESKKLLGES